MAANRSPMCAPSWVLSLSKATLADLVWDLASTSPECTSADDRLEVARALHDRAVAVRKVLGIPTRDYKLIAGAAPVTDREGKLEGES